MLNILKNFEDAASGKKVGTSGQAKNEMKSILESFHRVAEEKTVEECGAMPMGSSPMQQGNPVSMNVSINASGKEHVQDLIDMMKLAGASGAKELDHDDMPMIKKLPVPADMDKLAMMTAMDDDDEDDMEEEWDNAPDEEYRDHEYMTKDLAGGLNRAKKSYKPTAGGDNPMALEDQIRAELRAALQEKFSKKKMS